MNISAIGFLPDFHDKLCELSKSLIFEKEKLVQFHVMALYGSILEYASSMLILTQNSRNLAIPVVFRSLLDASLDLLNLCKNPKYGYRLDVDYLRGRKEFVGRAIRDQHKCLKGFDLTPELREQQRNDNARAKDLKSRGYSGIGMAEKFKLLDMEDDYFFIYKMLNHHVHNSINALTQRHIENDQDIFQVVYFKDTPLEDLEPYFGMTIELIMRCREKLHEVFESPVRRQVRELREEVDALRASNEIN